MKRQNRLLKNEDYKSVLDNHKCVNNKSVKVFYKLNDLDCSRIGISVSSKLGNSVVRHKIKRQITEIVMKCFDFSLNLDIVIIAKKEYLDLSYSQNYSIISETVELIKKKGKNKDEK